MNTQLKEPVALRLPNESENDDFIDWTERRKEETAAELCRLREENETLKKCLFQILKKVTECLQ
jgi:DNA-directed RNA polymerase sigma subunit (sigma70/sigma32)